jgi:hypothetical protein
VSGPIPFIASFSISSKTINWAKGDSSKVDYYPISISLSPNGAYAIILIPAQGSSNRGYVQVYDCNNSGALISSISYVSIPSNTVPYSPNSKSVLINTAGNGAYFMDRYIKSGTYCYNDHS